jgi:toxin ParE1/3/4
MAQFRLSKSARADLTAILATTLSRWGDEGRARYAKLLSRAMEELAVRPAGPLTRARTELAAGIRSFHVKHTRANPGIKNPPHLLLYQVRKGRPLEIVRVLHERMDLTAAVHLPMKSRTRQR